MEHYLDDGVMAAIEAVTRILPGQQIPRCGILSGGTLLSIAAAAMSGLPIIGSRR